MPPSAENRITSYSLSGNAKRATGGGCPCRAPSHAAGASRGDFELFCDVVTEALGI